MTTSENGGHGGHDEHDERANDSAAKHAHGTHGRGRAAEERVEPGEASGGSVIDKRPPEEWKRSQTE